MKGRWARAKRLLEKYPGAWLWLGVGGGFVLIIVRGILGSKQPNAPEVFTQVWIIDLLGDLGYLFVVGGFVGAISRHLALSGEYREALSDLLVADTWLENRKDLPDVWKRLTARIYLPKCEDSVFVKRVNDVIDANLKHDKDYYIKDMVSVLNVRWHNKSNGILEADQIQTLNIVPYYPNAPVLYKKIMRATSGLELQQYEVGETIKLDGKTKTFDKIEINGAGERVATITFGGQSIYHIEKTFRVRWGVDADPYMYTKFTNVMNNISIDVNCYADGIITSFFEVGMHGSFVDLTNVRTPPERQGGGDQHRYFPDVLLPGQGYVIIFRRVAVAGYGG